MAQTRGATGNSKPRVFPTISTAPVRKPRTAGAKKTKVPGVTKTRAPATQHKRKPSLKDKVVGAVEKAIGSAENKPGKKAAATKKMRGTDGKNSRTAKVAKI